MERDKRMVSDRQMGMGRGVCGGGGRCRWASAVKTRPAEDKSNVGPFITLCQPGWWEGRGKESAGAGEQR